MSDSDLIATATLSLCALLRDGLGTMPGAPEVLAAPPWQGPEFGVSVHLHAAAPSARARQEMGGGMIGAPGHVAPVALNLRYLLSFFGPLDLPIHRLAGRTMATLAANPVVTGQTLAETASRAGLASLEGAQMRLAVDPLTIEEMTSLWLRFSPMRYALSLGISCDIAC